jgi:hypothetical protein
VELAEAGMEQRAQAALGAVDWIVHLVVRELEEVVALERMGGMLPAQLAG